MSFYEEAVEKVGEKAIEDMAWSGAQFNRDSVVLWNPITKTIRASFPADTTWGDKQGEKEGVEIHRITATEIDKAMGW